MLESTTSPSNATVSDKKPKRPKKGRPKKTLHDRTLKSLKPAPKGETYEQMDSIVPGFGVRVSETGRKTFILIARFPGSPHPTRGRLGIYGALTLEQARNKARGWLEDIRKGIDPRDAEERQRQAEQKKRANTFAAVVEDFINLAIIGPDHENPKQRRGAKSARELRAYFCPLWGDMPIVDITREQIQKAIKGIVSYGGYGMLAAHGIKAKPRRDRKGKGAPGMARNLLANLKTLFSWAIEQNEYGLQVSPCAILKAKTLIGAKHSRQRALDNLELATLWRVSQRHRYPFRQVYQLLMLTGLRLAEVSQARWSEFDLKDRVWTIPAKRMKGTNEKARPHAVPLTDDMIKILNSLPRYNGGDCLFSFSFGERPAIVADKIKENIDARMLRSLRALARLRGEDPTRVKLEGWVNHDIRRTVRTGLARLRVDSDVAEAVLAHAKPGIGKTYNVYDYLDEKREALTHWGKRLHEITSPPEPQPDNVVKLSARA